MLHYPALNTELWAEEEQRYQLLKIFFFLNFCLAPLPGGPLAPLTRGPAPSCLVARGGLVYTVQVGQGHQGPP